MARTIGTPGESAATRGLLWIGLVVGGYLLLIVPICVWVLRDLGAKSGLLGVLLGLVAIATTLAFRRKDVAVAMEALREGGNFLKGARGEVLVHQALRALPSEFIVFNDFHPIDAASGRPAPWNVDHIVVGPTGVFVLDAKYYRNPRVPCAARSTFSAHNVRQAQRNALDLKTGLTKWSAGDLERLFVVPVVVYAQPDARLDCLREGSVRTIPLRLLVGEIQSHAESAIDQEKAGRIARVLYAQIGRDLQYSFKSEMDAYGELSKTARYAARDARVALAATAEAPASTPPTSPPTTCPLCGGRLVRRVARFGERAGKPFLGCSNYHSSGCRYGYNLDE
ncbi:MAG: hypothetical protein EG823_07940 [Actinobacteria bacterium]|nr:hypothetical protein [Actinomycetota bacterium]